MELPPLCHSDRSASGVEESTTWDDEPTQDKTCYLRRFLDSLRSLGMTCRGVVPFNQASSICNGASPSPGLDGVGSTPLHCSEYRVIPFTRTGCFCHVAGGRLPPLRHRPLDYRLIDTAQASKRGGRLVSPITVNCQLSTEELSIVNCQFLALTRWPGYC